ncbi:MAG TPA: aminopeptidase N, partial [Dermatophilaceae bacterium]|nr:aminopeptidase N [Dermatophilaceae bacterium]
MPSLTRAEATLRAASLTVTGYAVHLDLDAGDTRFASRTVVDFHVLQDGVQTWVDLKASDLGGAEVDGIPIEVGAWHDGRLALPALSAGEHR